jgi:hypothetical protein
LSALVGLLFVRGEFIPGLSQLDNQPQILAYAFLFGIAQQLVTGTVDRQAQEILKKVPSKEPVSTKPQPSLAEGQAASPVASSAASLVPSPGASPPAPPGAPPSAAPPPPAPT